MKYCLHFLLIGLVLPLAVLSQPRERMKQRPMERLELYKQVRMLEAMKLDEQQGSKLVARYNKHRGVMKELEQERAKLIDKLEAQVQSDASDVDYQKTFNELIDIEKKMIDARSKYLAELKDILTTKQIAEYVIFERSFARDIRDVMRDRMKKGYKE